MADCRITCVTKPDRLSPHEHITQVGNPAAGWIWPREQVIESIDSGTNTFYVLDPATGKRADVAVVRETGKQAFLRTHADGKWNNNLLSLDACLVRI